MDIFLQPLADHGEDASLDGIDGLLEGGAAVVDGEEGGEDKEALDELGRLGRGQPLEHEAEDVADVVDQGVFGQALDHGLQEVEALVVVGLGRQELLEDPEEGLDLVGGHHLLGAAGDVGLEKPHQGLDVGRPLPQDGDQQELKKKENNVFFY